jgi:hypothetical protein
MSITTKAALLSLLVNGSMAAMVFTLQPWALRTADRFFRLGYWILDAIFGGTLELEPFALVFSVAVNTVIIFGVILAALAPWERRRAPQV